jgi:hypothetical protein
VQSPVRIRLQWPLVIAPRDSAEEAVAAQADQFGRRLTAYQQYACNKFGSACRIALAVQRAENPRGACETYHYNSDGTLDWGYFQINTVHLKCAGVNLRGLLDCKANIDFAYQLYPAFESSAHAGDNTLAENVRVSYSHLSGLRYTSHNRAEFKPEQEGYPAVSTS